MIEAIWKIAMVALFGAAVNFLLHQPYARNSTIPSPLTVSPENNDNYLELMPK